MSEDFERLKSYFEKKWATKAQLKKYVQFGKISPEEYETITGEPYEVI
ncbi:XkdX family protein [Paenibacillus sp. WQ 127069]|uniref:XkdX family protein n=1 Tax=Paenibacillus baimaensis TaxID=2982185 RepID=A0ABT2UV35_9BACL|nr:XkdX family protein [Paenibacillus sp. WQ 127069]MCU6797991.1 XkdX family protein [Paenibacillus sp. WQ 127069]